MGVGSREPRLSEPTDADARIRALEEDLACARRTIDALAEQVEGAPDPLLTVDADGHVVACNRTALKYLGAPIEDVVGKPLAERFVSSDAVGVDRLARSGWTGVAERRFTLTDGRTATINAAPIDGSPPARYHVTLRDVTTRLALDDAEDQRRRMQALADLADAIARELNDPMSIVQGRLELLIDLGETDPVAIDRHLRVALDHARRISATLRNLRLVGRAAVPELSCVYLAEAIEDAVDLVGPRIRDVDLRTDLHPAELAAGGDLAMLARVFANLIGSVLDASGRSGRVEIRGRRQGEDVVVHVMGSSAARGYARIGRGVPGEPIDVVSLGGLGLSVANTLVGSVGGRLSARRVGGGLQFTVQLPGAPERPARSRPVEGRLLVVGRGDVGKTLEGLLARDGFAIERVPGADEALAKLAEDPSYAGVATELVLDGMSGLGLVAEIVARRPDLRGRVLLVSDSRLGALPPSVVALCPPLRREDVLEALGRKVRRRR